MKRFALACSLAVLSVSPVLAQKSAQATTTMQVNTTGSESSSVLRNSYQAKLNEFTTHLTRKNQPAAEQALKELMELMSKGIRHNSDKMNASTNSEEKEQFRKAYDSQNRIYSSVKLLMGDLSKNEGALVEKVRTFATTL